MEGSSFPSQIAVAWRSTMESSPVLGFKSRGNCRRAVRFTTPRLPIGAVRLLMGTMKRYLFTSIRRRCFKWQPPEVAHSAEEGGKLEAALGRVLRVVGH